MILRQELFRGRLGRAWLTGLAVALAIASWSCSDDDPTQPEDDSTPVAADFDGAVANDWFDLMLRVTKSTPGYSPPVAARSFLCAGISLYETVVRGMPDFQSLAGHVNGVGSIPAPEAGEIHWGAAANAALAAAVLALYPTAVSEDSAAVAALKNHWNDTFAMETSSEVMTRSSAYGNAVAGAVFDEARNDGGHEGYAHNFPPEYTPPTGEGLWVPTPPDFQPALQPYWGDVRSCLSENVTTVQPAPPPAFSTETTSFFYAQALEVLAVVNALTPAQRTIAEFWSDDPGRTSTPPGHSISIATQVLRGEDANLAEAAETYAKLGMAVHDAFVSCWKAKYTYNLVRPVTYIQQLMDPDWTSILTVC